MSLWPEHPHHDAEGAQEQAKKALARLAEGPGKTDWNNDPKQYIIGLWTERGTEILDFPQARVEHFPDAGEPTHLLVWTPSSAHSFDYHDVNYTYTPDPKNAVEDDKYTQRQMRDFLIIHQIRVQGLTELLARVARAWTMDTDGIKPEYHELFEEACVEGRPCSLGVSPAATKLSTANLWALKEMIELAEDPDSNKLLLVDILCELKGRGEKVDDPG